MTWTRRRVLASVAWVAVAAFLLNNVAVSALPYSAWGASTASLPRDDVRFLAPQGWGFFTRDPQEPRMHLYVEDAGRWQDVNAGPSNAARYAFGFSREARVQGLELGLLYQQIAQDAWVECGPVSAQQCLDGLATATSLSNVDPEPTLCGRVGIVQREPVPWAWRRSADEITMPGTAVVVEVDCR